MYHLSGNRSFRLKFRSPESLLPELEDDSFEQKVDSPCFFSNMTMVPVNGID